MSATSSSSKKNEKKFRKDKKFDGHDGPPSKVAKTDSGESSRSSASETRKERWRAKDAEFHYGNYDRYYGKRAVSVGQSKTGDAWNIYEFDDPRLEYFKREWFEGKKILDIGCNVGFLTVAIASQLSPSTITGLDIDGKLVRRARELLTKNADTKATKEDGAKKAEGAEKPGEKKSAEKKPETEQERTKKEATGPQNNNGCTGVKDSPQRSRKEKDTILDGRIKFEIGNYVLSDDTLLDFVQPEYDVILALSLTKWVHLNWGDDGIKRFFRRVYKHLNPGGIFIMEPQAWSTYKKKRGLTPEIARNYENIRFKPDRFRPYLMSEEVGFESYDVINQVQSEDKGKGFTRPIYLFRKQAESNPAKGTSVANTNLGTEEQDKVNVDG